MRHDVSMTPVEIFNRIINNKLVIEGYSFVILGKPGPTGKTSLYFKLLDHGFDVTEISEDIIGLIDFTDERNHIIVKERDKKIIIILNKPLERMK